MAHTEALLFIDDEEAEIAKLNVLGEQAMGSDGDVDFAFDQILHGGLHLLGWSEAGEHLDSHGKSREAPLEGFKVLQREDGGGGQNGDLLAIARGL